MFATVNLHLRRLASRRLIRHEHLDPARIERTLGFFVGHLPALLNAERCNILVYDPVAATVWLEAGTGARADGFEAPLQNTLIGAVIASGRPRIANDPADLRGTGAGLDRGPGIAVRNAAYAPIRSRYHAEVIGVIEALNKVGKDGFESADLRPLEEAAEIVQDLVDCVFLAQRVYGAADVMLTGSRQTAAAIAGLMLLGSIVTLLLMSAWSAMPVISDAISPSFLPFLPERSP
jgi:hypothetical protein